MKPTIVKYATRTQLNLNTRAWTALRNINVHGTDYTRVQYGAVNYDRFSIYENVDMTESQTTLLILENK